MEDLEKNDIKDAQIEEINDDKKENKKNYRTEIVLIFIIGLLLGIMIKAESLKKVSIGFSDYKVTGGAQGYDLDGIEERMLEESKAQQEEAANGAANQEAPAQEGASGENE